MDQCAVKKAVVLDGMVEELLVTVYGLVSRSVTTLPGFEDRNYSIQVKPEYKNKHITELWPYGYLMKIINFRDSKTPEMHDAQHSLMVHFKTNGIPTAEYVPDNSGNLFSKQKIYSNKEKTDYNTHIIKLMTYLPGEVLIKYPLSPELLYQDGVFVAKTIRALQGFEHQYYSSFDTYFNLSNISLLKKFLFVVKPENRKIVEEIIQEFEGEVLPSISSLPKSYIHGDLNESNILVMPEEGHEIRTSFAKQYKFTGLLDFQHTAYSCRIYDIVINMAYLMIFADTIDQLDVPGYVLAGYSTLLQVSDEEFDSLRILIAGRICQSLIFNAYNYQLDPSDIFLHTESRGWPLIRRFWYENKDKLIKKWKYIIKNPELNLPKLHSDRHTMNNCKIQETPEEM